jgi:hypothetical protein
MIRKHRQGREKGGDFHLSLCAKLHGDHFMPILGQA